jgi:hypothetical protein
VRTCLWARSATCRRASNNFVVAELHGLLLMCCGNFCLMAVETPSWGAWRGLKDSHVTDNGSIHKVCAYAVNRPVTIEFLHGGIAHGRDLMLAAQQREIRAEVPVAVADRFAERSERVRASLNERMLLFDAPAPA